MDDPNQGAKKGAALGGVVGAGVGAWIVWGAGYSALAVVGIVGGCVVVGAVVVGAAGYGVVKLLGSGKQ